MLQPHVRWPEALFLRLKLEKSASMGTSLSLPCLFFRLCSFLPSLPFLPFPFLLPQIQLEDLGEHSEQTHSCDILGARKCPMATIHNVFCYQH